MLGVIDDRRRRGLGLQLKNEQRKRALQMGVDLIEWTYDPLQALNAELNFNRLGVLVGEYEENIYGDSTSALHRGVPTDRFVAEWWIRSERVVGRMAGERPPAERFEVPAINRIGGGEWPTCDGFDRSLDEPNLAVEIPLRFTEMLERRADLARQWRSATREIFQTYLPRGYHVTEFSLGAARGRYLLTRDP
jgi:predicted GNAT superfamily acetyltransferase